MMRPIVSKKQTEMICNKQGSTWNDLHRTDSKFMEPLYLKNNKLEGSNVTKEAIDNFRGWNISYQLCIWKKNQNKCQNQVKQRNKTLNNHSIR